MEEQSRVRVELVEERLKAARERLDDLVNRYESRHQILEDRVSLIEQAQANYAGRFWAVSVGIGMVTVGLNLLFQIVEHWR
jgi:hypothetical protein